MANIVCVKITLAVTPTDEERESAVSSYQATPESPEPDEEWVLEEVAMNRLKGVQGVVETCVVDANP